ncbi:MAG: UDP-N-acetylglucosamine 2-epimerase [Rhizobiales bacterium NRL2]|jgi:UDP-N-acetylglucosamine 2-epimerase (non-hydrolysing)|nr:MAG: UDP-N-acetylglucosamine 2-epimerase [Rhizobiales bacterium NRL2]
MTKAISPGKYVHIVGARPNFMKMAPVYRALLGRAAQIIIHTGQHYDAQMSGDFFQVLDIPEPEINLAVGSGSHAEQTGRILIELGVIFGNFSPRAVIVYGDVNSTLAATLAASKIGIPVIHVESGLRSYDNKMPEEINRLVVDRLSDLLLTHSRQADENLRREGISDTKIIFVGNTMIDTLRRMLPQARIQDLSRLGLPVGPYGLVTLHRPSNVDEARRLKSIADALVETAKRVPLVFPVHPRTRAKLSDLELKLPGVQLLDPQGYTSFIALQQRAAFVVTDSGGVQEEATWLNIPCLTLRPNTERPVTISDGTNTLIGEDPHEILPHVCAILEGRYKEARVPEGWDGAAAERAADAIIKMFGA